MWVGTCAVGTCALETCGGGSVRGVHVDSGTLQRCYLSTASSFGRDAPCWPLNRGRVSKDGVVRPPPRVTVPWTRLEGLRLRPGPPGTLSLYSPHYLGVLDSIGEGLRCLP